MRRLCVIAIAVLAMFCIPSAFAEDHIEAVKNGNSAYKAGDYKKALEFYHSAETDLPESPELEYNMAGALHQEGGYEEAVDRYVRALRTTEVDLEAAAHYNLGNTHFRMEDYQNAVMSYQKSLEINPDDLDAKYNLELARRKLKEQMKPQCQQQPQEQRQQEQDQQEQQQQDQQENPEDEQQQQQQQQQDERQQQEPQPQPQDQKEISKEDAERILNALKDDEQEIQKKQKRRQAAGDYRGKDW